MPSTTGQAAAPAALVKKRRAAAERLLAIRKKLADDFLQIERLEAELKSLASEGGDSFKEDFGAQGSVSVSPPKPKTFKGEVPVVVTEAWLKLKDADREKLTGKGIIVVEQQWSQAYGGRVTVKVL